MNHEIISVTAPREYFKAFIEKNIRPDKRQLTEKRGLLINQGILDSEKYSCSCTLGDGNRVLAVLKKKSGQENSKIGLLKVILDMELNNQTDEHILYTFIDKLLR